MITPDKIGFEKGKKNGHGLTAFVAGVVITSDEKLATDEHAKVEEVVNHIEEECKKSVLGLIYGDLYEPYMKLKDRIMRNHFISTQDLEMFKELDALILYPHRGLGDE